MRIYVSSNKEKLKIIEESKYIHDFIISIKGQIYGLDSEKSDHS